VEYILHKYEVTGIIVNANFHPNLSFNLICASYADIKNNNDDAPKFGTNLFIYNIK